MPVHIALLRGINVGGKNKVSMPELRELLGALGFTSSRSLLNSGNIVFVNERLADAELERVLEVETEKRFRVSVVYVVRTVKEWDRIIARNPFPGEAKRDPSHLLVMCLKEPAKAKAVKELEAAIVGPESIRANGRELYLTYPAGIGTSKLTNTLIERKLGIQGTARNWNTVLKLAELAQEAETTESLRQAKEDADAGRTVPAKKFLESLGRNKKIRRK
jgi:uncharacterized protein (DUF1697 family)